MSNVWIEAQVLVVTKKAILIQQHPDVWIPRSQISDFEATASTKKQVHLDAIKSAADTVSGMVVTPTIKSAEVREVVTELKRLVDAWTSPVNEIDDFKPYDMGRFEIADWLIEDKGIDGLIVDQ